MARNGGNAGVAQWQSRSFPSYPKLAVFSRFPCKRPEKHGHLNQWLAVGLETVLAIGARNG
jgi:hypothetical protein